MKEIIELAGDLPVPLRVLAFIGLAIATHLVVIAVRFLASYILASKPNKEYQKLRSLLTLATSGIIFTLYFFTFGLILQEFGVSLSAYLASATVVGLAIGFGLQGVVQDVVTGLTFIFSDLVDVGDLVEISGQTGVVQAITMRFVQLENAMGATVFIPNRTINNIINYPRGYVRCIVDITLRGDDAAKAAVEQAATQLTQTTRQQFPGILLTDPSIEGRINLHEVKEILRIKFRIWPNRGQPIETTFVQEMAAEIQRNDPEYKLWMISISYEAEAKKVVARKALPWKRRGGN